MHTLYVCTWATLDTTTLGAEVSCPLLAFGGWRVGPIGLHGRGVVLSGKNTVWRDGRRSASRGESFHHWQDTAFRGDATTLSIDGYCRHPSRPSTNCSLPFHYRQVTSLLLWSLLNTTKTWNYHVLTLLLNGLVPNDILLLSVLFLPLSLTRRSLFALLHSQPVLALLYTGDQCPDDGIPCIASGRRMSSDLYDRIFLLIAAVLYPQLMGSPCSSWMMCILLPL